MIAGRDSRGRFIKGNVIGKKRLASTQGQILFTCRFCGRGNPIEEMAGEMEVAKRFFPPFPACKDCFKQLERGIAC